MQGLDEEAALSRFLTPLLLACVSLFTCSTRLMLWSSIQRTLRGDRGARSRELMEAKGGCFWCCLLAVIDEERKVGIVVTRQEQAQHW